MTLFGNTKRKKKLPLTVFKSTCFFLRTEWMRRLYNKLCEPRWKRRARPIYMGHCLAVIEACINMVWTQRDNMAPIAWCRIECSFYHISIRGSRLLFSVNRTVVRMKPIITHTVHILSIPSLIWSPTISQYCQIHSHEWRFYCYHVTSLEGSGLQ